MRHEGHIRGGGGGKDVSFVEETADDVNEGIDDAYRTKYRRHGGRYAGSGKGQGGYMDLAMSETLEAGRDMVSRFMQTEVVPVIRV